jgi:hypothetical protein
MGKTRSKAVDQISEAISLLQNASRTWPEGSSHPLIKEILHNAEVRFLKEFYEVSNVKGSKEAVEANRKVPIKKD